MQSRFTGALISCYPHERTPGQRAANRRSRNPSIQQIGVKIRPLPVPGFEQLKQFILDYQKDLLSTGLTTVQTDDFKLWDATIDDILDAYEELDKEGKLNVRFIQQLRLITDAQLDAMEADNRG